MATVTPGRTDAVLDQTEPDYLYEVVDGRFVEKTMGVYENWLAAVIFGRLDRYADENSIGRAVIEMIFDLRPHVDRERRPDVAFVSFERWARDRGIPQTRSWAVAPDLAIEIVSASNTAVEIAEKFEEFFLVGVRAVWVVYPARKKIYAYTSPTQVRILGVEDELSGGDMLPGFRLSVRDLFDKAGEPA